MNLARLRLKTATLMGLRTTAAGREFQMLCCVILLLSGVTLNRNVHRILVTGSMPSCRLRRRKFWKFDYEMVHSEVYLNKYAVSIAPFSTPACPDCSQNCSFLHVFAFYFFIHFFRRGGMGSADFPGWNIKKRKYAKKQFSEYFESNQDRQV